MKLLRPPQRSVWHFNTLIFFMIDLTLLLGCVMGAFMLSPSNPYPWSVIPGQSPLYLQAIFLPIFMALGLLLSGSQRLQARFKRSETLVRVFVGSGVGSLIFTLVHALITFQVVGRYIILISWCLGVICIFLARFALSRVTETSARAVFFWSTEATARSSDRALCDANLPIHIIGRYLEGALSLTQHARDMLVHERKDNDQDQAELELSLETSQDQAESELTFSSPVPLTPEELYDYCVRHRIESLVLSQPEALSLEEKRALTSLISRGVRVQTINHFFEAELERVHVESIQESWLWDHELTTPYYLGIKRLIDISLSLIGILCLTPIAPFIALFIWLQDRGPILYTQERLGLYGVPFKIYKFRTMRVDAEREGAQWAQQGDHRVTWLGRMLRKTRLDETPQFFNILFGDMSFVGPRPEREELMREIERELPSFRFRHLAKPGLSGWAQINYGYGSTIEEARVKLSYDLYYLKHASVALDLLIVLRTFSAMMRGAR